MTAEMGARQDYGIYSYGEPLGQCSSVHSYGSVVPKIRQVIAEMNCFGRNESNPDIKYVEMYMYS